MKDDAKDMFDSWQRFYVAPKSWKSWEQLSWEDKDYWYKEVKKKANE